MTHKNRKNQTPVDGQSQEATTTRETQKPLLIHELGWSEEEVKETYYRFLTFQEDWEAPGMEAYDEL